MGEPNGLSQASLDRISRVFVRLADPNPGTQVSAGNILKTLCLKEGIDVRDLRVTVEGHTNGNGASVDPTFSPKMAAMKEAFKSMHIPKVEELEKLRKANDDLTMTIAGYKTEIKEAKATRKSIEKQVAKLNKATERAGRKTASESKLVGILKRTLVAVCPPFVKAPMSQEEFKAVGERAYGDQFFATLLTDLRTSVKPGGNVPPWLRIVLRQAVTTAPKQDVIAHSPE